MVSSSFCSRYIDLSCGYLLVLLSQDFERCSLPWNFSCLIKPGKALTFSLSRFFLWEWEWWLALYIGPETAGLRTTSFDGIFLPSEPRTLLSYVFPLSKSQRVETLEKYSNCMTIKYQVQRVLPQLSNHQGLRKQNLKIYLYLTNVVESRNSIALELGCLENRQTNRKASLFHL